MMTRILRRATLAVAAAAAAAAGVTPLAAQAPNTDPTLVDKIVAVVGDSVILRSQVEEARQQLKFQGENVPSGGPALEQFDKQILDQLVDNVLLLQAAAKDTLVKVDDAQIDKTVNDEIKRRSQQFSGGGPAFQQALLKQGFTLPEYRDYLKSQVRQQQIRSLYLQDRLRNAPPVEVSNEEVLDAFQKAKDRLPQVPRTITFQQVVITPTPTDSEWAEAKTRAEGILDRIRKGEDFAKLAKEFSEDLGTKAQGGELGWFRRGDMIKPLEDAAWSLYDGGVSGLVKSELGYHIVKLERSRPGEREARHILIRPKMSDADVSSARLQADSVADLARAGTPMEKLYTMYSDSTAPDTLSIPFNQISQLPPSYARALQLASAGQVLGPLEYSTARGDKRFAVVRVKQIREAHAYTFDEAKTQLAQTVKQNKQIEKIITDLKQKTHIDIRM